MKLSSGVTGLPTIAGAFVSIVIYILMVGYVVQKSSIMLLRSDNEMMSIEKEFFYDDLDVMDSSQFLNVAVAFTGYDNDQENLLDPSIGELQFTAN